MIIYFLTCTIYHNVAIFYNNYSLVTANFQNQTIKLCSMQFISCHLKHHYRNSRLHRDSLLSLWQSEFVASSFLYF